MLAVSDVATSPRDAIQRKRMVVAYNRRHPNTQMDRNEGYTIIQPGQLPGSEPVIRLAQQLSKRRSGRSKPPSALTPRCTQRSGRSCEVS